MRRLSIHLGAMLTAGSCLLPSRLQAQGMAVVRPPVLAASVAVAVRGAPAAAALALGSWTGPLPLPGKELTVGLTISQQATGLVALLDIPGGPVRQRRLVVTQYRDTLRLYEPSLQLTYVCSASADGQELAGQWVQVGLQQRLVLHRGTPAATANGQRVSRTAFETKWENGTLENGQPVGVWNYYRLDAVGDYVLSRSYDHTAHRLTYARPESEAFDAEVSPGQWERTVLTQAAWFIGRHDALAAFGSQLNYPIQARQSRTQGKVYVSFAVDTLGRVSDYRILRGLGNGCDEEALRVARTIPGTWTPARLGNKAVASRQILPVGFKLD